MCGSLRRENKALILRGSIVPIRASDGQVVQGFWSSHAREETLKEKWLNAGWKEGHLPEITSYTEGYGDKRKEFLVPTGKAIKIIFFPGVVTPKGGHPFHIVTREAEGDEATTHPRFPRLVNLEPAGQAA